ncbi:MAG: hypothetical protein HQK49_16900 [Oligoflexia bacterium]|nr:hypothetical protein [Oligoflexia bacterium]
MDNILAENKQSQTIVELCSPGALGTCWYGKYHYIEPYIGCAHNCLYCYACSREIVRNSLNQNKHQFKNPTLITNKDLLLKNLQDIANNNNLNIVKLSRYTDIFSPPFDTNGVAFQILETLALSKISRIIITTKGIASPQVIELMKYYSQKFSYNLVAKPELSIQNIKFEQNISSLNDRLENAQKIQSIGVKTTIHMDPLVPGFDDNPELLLDFFLKLKKYNLTRVMFSYLLLNKEIISRIALELGDDILDKILSYYQDDSQEMLPSTTSDLCYIDLKPHLKQQSVDTIVSHLKAHNFEYVLCSLKTDKESIDLVRKSCACNICDGSFYA